jgi:thiol peroxidase
MSDVERKNAVTFKGNAITLVGSEIKVGQKAPDFKVIANDLSEVTLQSSKGKTRVISVVPSLDTPVCQIQTNRFNAEAAKFSKDTQVYAISVDLPFAQKRWCGANEAENIQPLSDHRELSFGKAYGVLIKELKLLARAVFIIGADDKVQYVEYVKEVTKEPNYEAALNVLKVAK